MTAATFDCPHCGAKYPVKPVLVGKTVRCTTCKNAFSLRADGIADKIVMPASTQSVAAAKPPTVQAPSAQPKSVSTPAPATAPATAPAEPPRQGPATGIAQAVEAAKNVQTATSRINAPTPKVSLTEQQLEARKAMSENLKAAMSDAMKADVVDLGGEPDPTTPDKSGKPGTARTSKSSSYLKTGAGGKKAGKTPAILTNEGEREAANSRNWLIGFVAVVLVVGFLSMLLLHRNERAAAVDAFTVELPRSDLQYGRRLEAIRARAWTTSVTPFLDLPKPRISSEHELAATSLEPLLKLKGLVYVASAERWVTADTAAWMEKLPAGSRDKAEAKLERDGAIQVTLSSLRKALSAANLNDDEMTIALALLNQDPGTDTTHPIPKFAELLAQGNLPTIRWCSVSGKGGTHMFDPGQGYRTATADYHGLLVSFAGDGWPTGWRFMTLAATK